MRIVIEIPDRIYKIIQNRTLNIMDDEILENALRNGTPLPEHHGRLIDADKLPYEDIESIDGNTYMCVNAYDIDHAPTIIEGSDSE